MSRVLSPTLIDGIKCYSPGEAARYDDYPDDGFDLTEKLEAESFWVRSRNRLLKRVVATLTRPLEKARFLEIGCGTGTFIREIAGNGKLSITGSEIYVKGLHYAKRKLPGVEFIQFDAKQGTLPERFDVVAAFDVIEHIDDDVAVMANIHRMLNDRGWFIITVPQYRFLWSRLDEIVKHKRRYSRHDLTSKLKGQGFSIAFCSSFVFVLFPLMLLSRLLDRGRRAPESAPGEFEDRVRFPGLLNWALDKLMRIDELLIGIGLALPYGGSLLVVARRDR